MSDSLVEPVVPFPEGRQFAVTWGVTTEFGGMTAAMLRRSNAFARLAARPVDVLTFDARDDYAEIEATLRSDGRMGSDLGLRNLWDELASLESVPATLRGSKAKALDSFAPLTDGHGDGLTRRRVSDSGELLQIDRFRADGTVAISDRRDVANRGTIGGRSIVLADADGAPTIGFTRARPFYQAWLDLVLGDDDAFLLVDSKTSAATIAGYQNPRVTRVHLLHNSHLATDDRPWAPVKPSRRETLAIAADFDAVVLLSDRQRSDVDALLALGDRLEIVPNAAALPERTPVITRNSAAGVSVAGLEKRKRVQHAVEAVRIARDAGSDVRLDVYGDGPERKSLATQVTRDGLDDAVHLHGYSQGAVDHFADASFFTLTSTSEGFPLVLAEGMSRGAIPVSYDISYGPADIIEDGANGYLVPLGDVDAFAAALIDVAATPPDRLDAMRAAAMRSAERFTDDAVTRRWAEVLGRAAERRPASRSFTVTVKSASHASGRDSLEVSADFRLSGVDVSPSDLDAAIALHGAPTAVELRRPATVRRTLRHGVWRAKAEFESDSVGWIPAGTAFTADLELRIAGRLVRERLSFADEPTGSFSHQNP